MKYFKTYLKLKKKMLVLFCFSFVFFSVKAAS